MKNIVLIIALLFSNIVLVYAQPTKMEVAPKKEGIENVPFDSTRNWLGNENVYSYRGQELYVLPNRASFIELKNMSFTSMTSTVASGYSYGANSILPYAERDVVEDKIFVVDSVYKHMIETSKYVFVMHFKDNPENKCQFLYDTRFEFNFPFLVMSYYNYLVNKCTNKTIVCWNKIYDSDVETGEKIVFDGEYMEWECYGVSIIEGVVLNLKNKLNGQKSYVSVEYLFPTSVRVRAFIKEDWDALVKLYGIDVMTCVMNSTIKIGMPVAALKMSWGLPKTINTPSFGDEQWVNKNDFVYVKDGKVTAWN